MTKKKVLIPIENSEFSLEILPTIQRLFNPAQTQLILLHVEPKPESMHIERPGLVPVDIYADELEAGMSINFADRMRPLLEPLRKAGFEVTTDMAFGKPAQAIERLLEYEPVDLVAMTTHGRRGLERVMLGSVAEHLLRHTHTPVLLLHPVGEVEENELFPPDSL